MTSKIENSEQNIPNLGLSPKAITKPIPKANMRRGMYLQAIGKSQSLHEDNYNFPADHHSHTSKSQVPYSNAPSNVTNYPFLQQESFNNHPINLSPRTGKDYLSSAEKRCASGRFRININLLFFSLNQEVVDK